MAAYKKGDLVIVRTDPDVWAMAETKILLVGWALRDFTMTEWFDFVRKENKAGRPTFTVQSLVTLKWLEPIEKWKELLIED